MTYSYINTQLHFYIVHRTVTLGNTVDGTITYSYINTQLHYYTVDRTVTLEHSKLKQLY